MDNLTNFKILYIHTLNIACLFIVIFENKGEEYALKQSWGEQMHDMHFSVIVILHVETDKFNVIEMPNDQFPTDLQWVDNNSIIGTSYAIKDWRLGLIYCTNRESQIFQINVDGSNLRTFL